MMTHIIQFFILRIVVVAQTPNIDPARRNACAMYISVPFATSSMSKNEHLNLSRLAKDWYLVYRKWHAVHCRMP